MHTRPLIILTTLSLLVVPIACERNRSAPLHQARASSTTDNGSNITVNIDFDGAIAFVPEPTATAGTFTKITALAAKATDINFLKLPPAANRIVDHIPLHYAFLRVNARNYCEDAASPCIANPSSGDAEVLIPLLSDDIQIPGVTGSSGGGITRDVSFSQIPRLEDYSSHSSACIGCVNGSSATADLVAARIQFSAGTFKVIGPPAKDGTGTILIWKFVSIDRNSAVIPSSGPLMPAIYEMAELTSVVAGSDIMVTLQPLVGGTGRSFRLAPAPIDHDSLNIALVNLPGSEILKRPPHYRFDPEIIGHFELFYILTKSVATDPDAYPFPSAVNFQVSGGKPYCSNAILNP
jgi:hypothetical protein